MNGDTLVSDKLIYAYAPCAFASLRETIQKYQTREASHYPAGLVLLLPYSWTILLVALSSIQRIGDAGLQGTTRDKILHVYSQVDQCLGNLRLNTRQDNL